jgi:Tfp pilus assembly protein PilV
MKSFRQNKKRKGQSLVELLVSLSILTVGFLGMSSLLSKSFFLNRVNTTETIGTYLAAEGIEITKNIIDHDTYALPAHAFAWGTCGGICAADGWYKVDYTYQTPQSTPGQCAGVSALNFSTSTGAGLYSYSVGTPSGFSRCIQITHNNGGREVTVSSKVTWSTGPITGASVVLEDHFYNWHP